MSDRPKPDMGDPMVFAEAMSNWWYDTIDGDLKATIPKLAEYGTRDLTEIGHFFKRDLPEEQAAVYGIAFYAVGKLARMIAALNRGEMPSEDTLFDLSVYSMMARFYGHLERNK